MSLVKQLWIGIIILLIIALGGSFLISSLTAKEYLEQQLQLKNYDTATSMALSLSQMEKDQVTIGLLISAQFDTGHYESIRLIAPNNNIITEHNYADTSDNNIPNWFRKFITLNVSPGIAQIQDGWQQYGTLHIQSHTGFAEETLWKSTVQLIQWLFIASSLCGLIGTFILKLITKPLNNVITQAEAIGQRKFITSKEPKTWEFKLLVQAMNKLSASVKAMLERKTQELERLRTEAQLDSVTKLPNREHFVNLLDSSLTKEDTSFNGSLCIVRVLNLSSINETIGHENTNKVLQKVATIFTQEIIKNKINFAGRLNGTDFALVSFDGEPIEPLANRLSEALSKQLDTFIEKNISLALPIAGCHYHAGESKGELLTRIDGALALAEQKGNRAVVTLQNQTPSDNNQNANDWRSAIENALNTKHIKLGEFSVRSIDGDLIHTEMPARLNFNDQWQPAGYFIGWAVRLKLLKDIDFEVLKLALKEIKKSPRAIAINMSEDALCSFDFRIKVKELIERNINLAPNLWIEFPESCAVRHLKEFRQFCTILRSLGCHIGLEHVGLEFTQIRELHDIGLQYLKIDSAIIRDIDTQNNNHEFVKNLCAIGDSLGIAMIAEGVTSESEWNTLKKLNLDGVTGPGVD